jgi:anti-sigma regulatory factor (Ser/Thr protein kinase)
VDDSARSAALLCAQEALVNAITHGGAGKSPVAVSVRIDDGELRMEVSDRGGGCDPARLDLESLPDPLGEHGRGLFLIQHLMDDFHIISDCQGTTLRMTLHLC